MRFALTDDQLALRAALRELLHKECTPEALRLAWDSENGRIPGLWEHLAALGVTGLLVPESAGGLGLGDVDLAVVMEEAGRFAVPEPLLGTIVGGSVTGVTDQVVALGLEPGKLVEGAEYADLLVLQEGAFLHAVPRSDVRLLDEPTVDRGIRLAHVTWIPAPATHLAFGDVHRTFDRAVLGAAAQLVGVAGAMLDMAVAYAKEREQFGKPIGSFQAVKHHLADVYVAIEFARPVVLRAAWSGTSRDASAAKHAAIRAARLSARAALQVHGAIGYTFEHDLHMWLKRSWSLAPRYGDENFHRDRAVISP